MPHSSLPKPELFMVQLSPQTDSFIIQPIFWVEILLQPSHSIHHQGSGDGQVKRFACRKHICQTLLGPGIPAHPLFMARLCPAALPAEPRAVGAGGSSEGLFSTAMPMEFPWESAPLGARWRGFSRTQTAKGLLG